MPLDSKTFASKLSLRSHNEAIAFSINNCKLVSLNIFLFLILQDKFSEAPVVLVTSEHLRLGKEYDAALIWVEDSIKSSFKACLREMQNFDGKHEDIIVVCA